MGHSLIPIPFWTDTIKISEVIAASRASDLQLTSLSKLSKKRLAYASLYRRDDNGHFVLRMHNDEFIEFIPR